MCYLNRRQHTCLSAAYWYLPGFRLDLMELVPVPELVLVRVLALVPVLA
jgi:hypothetical protein